MTKRTKPSGHKRLKAIAVVAAAVTVGILLLVLSHRVAITEQKAGTAPVPVTQQPVTKQSATQQPATQQASPTTAPATPETPPGDPTQPQDPYRPASMNMSGFLLLFSMVSFGVALIAVGWIAYDIHRSRPAWKTQTKYPKRR